MEVTKAQYVEQRHRRFGRGNPERMNMPFWEMMVRCGKGAYWAQEHFHDSYDDHTTAVWCFDRYGMSETTLGDGRTVCVGGEHEDYYDPDFCIYNEVVVKGPWDHVEIFGYPREVFPPTDFHSATLHGDRIILIGNLGYRDERRPGYTQVFSLTLSDFSMTRLDTTGVMPGWISRHDAEGCAEGQITISRGVAIVERDGEQRSRRNVEAFSLDVASGRWRQLTSRNWPEFCIRPTQVQYLGVNFMSLALTAVRPIGIPHTVMPGGDWQQVVLLVEGIPVSITLNHREVSVVVEGSLPADLIGRLTEEIRLKAETVFKSPCLLEQF